MKRGHCLPRNQIFDRGRLLITSKGRILTWKANFDQLISFRPFAPLLRLCLGPDPAKYNGYTETGSYMLSDIAEIVYDTYRTPSYLCGACCCAETFEGSIRVYFNRFDTHNRATSSLKCGGISSYEKKSNGIFGGILHPEPAGGGESSGLFSKIAALLGDDSSYIELTSMKENEILYDYENRKSDVSFSNLADLYKMLNRAVCQTRRMSAWTPPTGACASGLLTATPVDSPWGNVDTVQEKKVDLPVKYAGLAEGETVLAAETNMYIMTILDRVLSVISLGLYYFFVVSDKRMKRPSFVLTTKRFIEVTPYVEDGCLSTIFPQELLSAVFPVNRGMTVRSLYPRQVYSGYLRRLDWHIDCSLCTDCGSIDFSFDQIWKGLLEDLTNETRYARKMRFCHALMSTATRAADFKPGEMAFIPVTKEESDCFPLADGENVMARYKGSIPDPVCAERFPGLCNVERSYHPGACMSLSCGVVPTISDTSVTLTTSSVFTFRQNTNYPFMCWSFLLPFIKKQDWELMWTPLNHFVSMAVNTTIVGNDDCVTRTCEGSFFGRNCCPRTKSVLTITVDARTNPGGDGTLRGIVQNMDPFKTLRMSPELKAFREALARVQANLIDNSPEYGGLNLQSLSIEPTVSPILAVPAASPTAVAVEESFDPPKTKSMSRTSSNQSEGLKI